MESIIAASDQIARKDKLAEEFTKITCQEAPSGRLEPGIPRTYPINSNSKDLLILKANKV